MSQDTDRLREKAVWLDTRAHETHFPNLKWDFEIAASGLRNAANLLEQAEQDSQRLDWLENNLANLADYISYKNWWNSEMTLREFADKEMAEENT